MRRLGFLRVGIVVAALGLVLPGVAQSQAYNIGQPQQPGQPTQPSQPAQPGQPTQPGQTMGSEIFPRTSESSAVPKARQASNIPIMNEYLQQQERQWQLKRSLYGLDPSLQDRPAGRIYK